MSNNNIRRLELGMATIALILSLMGAAVLLGVYRERINSHGRDIQTTRQQINHRLDLIQQEVEDIHQFLMTAHKPGAGGKDTANEKPT